MSRTGAIEMGWDRVGMAAGGVNQVVRLERVFDGGYY